MSLRIVNGNPTRCWARLVLDERILRCAKAPGHTDEHYSDGQFWIDHGLGPVIDVDLDGYRGGAA